MVRCSFLFKHVINVLAILKKNLNDILTHFEEFRTCTIVTKALMPLDRTSCIEMYADNVITLNPGSFVEHLKDLSRQ